VRRASELLTIRSTFTDQGAVLQMMGSMGAHDFSKLHSELVGILRTSRRTIVLDFHDVEHVSYREASRLALEFELVRSYRGDMKVSGLTPYVRDILVFAGLSGFLEADTSDSGAFEGPDSARVPRAS
jgi:anti-anti-sigma regulatory factor